MRLLLGNAVITAGNLRPVASRLGALTMKQQTDRVFFKSARVYLNLELFMSLVPTIISITPPFDRRVYVQRFSPRKV